MSSAWPTPSLPFVYTTHTDLSTCRPVDLTLWTMITITINEDPSPKPKNRYMYWRSGRRMRSCFRDIMIIMYKQPYLPH